MQVKVKILSGSLWTTKVSSKLARRAAPRLQRKRFLFLIFAVESQSENLFWHLNAQNELEVRPAPV